MSGYSPQPYPPYGPPSGMDSRWFGHPMPDFRARGGQYEPSHGFANPGSLNLGGGAAGMMGNLLISMMTGGKPMRPMGGFEGPGIDYIQSWQRQAAAQDPGLRRMLPVDPILTTILGQKAGSDPTLQALWGGSGFSAMGSPETAARMISGRMGALMGGSIREQAINANRAVAGIAEGFSTNGRYDLNKSYGFTLDETVGNMDSMRRYGFMPGGKMAMQAALNDPQAAARLARSSNETISLGKQTFGSDMSGDEISDLMSKALGGMSGLTTEKASDFLAKVQATSRALDINAKGFAEYMAMQQSVYKGLGLGGATASNAIINAATTGSVISEMAQSGQNGGALRNQQVAGEAAQRNAARRQGSATVNQVRAAAAIYDTLSDADKATLKVNGQSVLQVIQSAEAAANRGDDRMARSLINDVSKAQGGKFSDVVDLSRHMNEAMSERADKWTDQSASIIGGGVRAKYLKDLSSSSALKDDMALINSKGGMKSVFEDVGNFHDPAEMKAALMAKGFSEEQATRVAANADKAAMSRDARLTDPAGTMAALASSSKKGQAAIRKEQEKVGAEADKARLLNRRMGSLAKGLGISDALGAAADFAAEAAKGGYSTEALKKAAESALGHTLSPKELEAIGEAAKPGGEMDQKVAAANEAKRQAKEAGKSQAEQEKAKSDILNADDGLTDEERKKSDASAKDIADQKAASKANGNEKSENLLQKAVNALEEIVKLMGGGAKGRVSAPPAPTPDLVGPSVPADVYL